MKDMQKLKEMLCKELDEYSKKGELSAGSLDVIHKLTSSIKNIDKIETLEQEAGYSERRGYSRDSEWMGRGEYGDSYESGTSGRGRGMHYVRGHYSREGDGDSSYEGGSSYRRGYSRAEGKEEMLQMIDEMMSQAETEKQREALHRCRTELARA